MVPAATPGRPSPALLGWRTWTRLVLHRDCVSHPLGPKLVTKLPGLSSHAASG